MPRTASLNVVDLIELSNDELTGMLDDPESPLHLTFTELVCELSDRFRTRADFTEFLAFTIGRSGMLEIRTVTFRAKKVSDDLVLLPHTQQLGVRLVIDGEPVEYFVLSIQQYLFAIEVASSDEAIDRLRTTLTRLDELRHQ